ncbi:MAG: hypothetical protein WAT09_15610 [Paracoccaceae bacterium]
MIFFEKMVDNPFDAFPARLKGLKATASSAVIETWFWRATF